MIRLLARLWCWPLVIFFALAIVGCWLDPGDGTP